MPNTPLNCDLRLYAAVGEADGEPRDQADRTHRRTGSER